MVLKYKTGTTVLPSKDLIELYTIYGSPEKRLNALPMLRQEVCGRDRKRTPLSMFPVPYANH